VPTSLAAVSGFVLAVAKHHQIVTAMGARKAVELAVRPPGHGHHK
jgi:hypothetical protein